MIEPVSVVASTWKTELAGSVTLTEPVFVVNWYDPVLLIEPLNVTEPVFDCSIELEVNTPSLILTEPVLLLNDIRPLTPLTSIEPVFVLSSSAVLAGTVTSKSTLGELKKLKPVDLFTLTVIVLASLLWL